MVNDLESPDIYGLENKSNSKSTFISKADEFFNRACLITLHSNFEIFQKGHPAVEFMLDRRIFER